MALNGFKNGFEWSFSGCRYCIQSATDFLFTYKNISK